MFLCKVKAHDDYVNKKRKVLVLECIGHNFFPMPHEEHFFYLVFNSKPQSHKMVKHTETIRRQFAYELFECVWPCSEIGA